MLACSKSAFERSGTRSREESASKQEAGAFSSEVDTGSREENVSKQEAGILYSQP
jgi:hypothetical protein